MSSSVRGRGSVASGLELIVREGQREAVELAAQELARAAAAGGHVALSGGSVQDTYELAALLQPAWDGVELWWVDERCVPPDDERSNFGLVRGSLLDRLETPPRAVHGVETELGPERAAERYDADLAGVELAFAFMGIGPDGHTASLFPHAPALDERERRAVAAPAEFEPLVERVTLTIPVLSAARVLLFLVTGEAKADAVGRAFGQPPSPATPASLVRSAGGRTVVILDRAAAASLDG